MAIRKFTAKNIPIRYKNPEFNLISIEEMDSLNEGRLFFEVFLTLGAAFLGPMITNFNWPFFFMTISLLGLAIFFGIRYFTRYAQIKKEIKNG